MKLRFDIGLYGFKSSGLSVGFSSLSFTIACLCTDGKTLSLKDALHIRVMGSASIDSSRFTNHVGAGSRAQCFTGAPLTTFVTSSMVTSLNVCSVSLGRGSILGCGALDVELRITLTFDWKWLANASAVWAMAEEGACDASSSALILDHSALVSLILSLIDERQ